MDFAILEKPIQEIITLIEKLDERYREKCFEILLNAYLKKEFGLQAEPEVITEEKEEEEYFFKKSLGRGYNAAVIARELSSSIHKDNNIEDANLKVKLLDYKDLVDGTTLITFFEKFFEGQDLCIRN